MKILQTRKFVLHRPINILARGGRCESPARYQNELLRASKDPVQMNSVIQCRSAKERETDLIMSELPYDIKLDQNVVMNHKSYTSKTLVQTKPRLSPSVECQ